MMIDSEVASRLLSSTDVAVPVLHGVQPLESLAQQIVHPLGLSGDEALTEGKHLLLDLVQDLAIPGTGSPGHANHLIT